jgi:hypothetical protein
VLLTTLSLLSRSSIGADLTHPLVLMPFRVVRCYWMACRMAHRSSAVDQRCPCCLYCSSSRPFVSLAAQPSPLPPLTAYPSSFLPSPPFTNSESSSAQTLRSKKPARPVSSSQTRKTSSSPSERTTPPVGRSSWTPLTRSERTTPSPMVPTSCSSTSRSESFFACRHDESDLELTVFSSCSLRVVASKSQKATPSPSTSLVEVETSSTPYLLFPFSLRILTYSPADSTVLSITFVGSAGSSPRSSRLPRSLLPSSTPRSTSRSEKTLLDSLSFVLPPRSPSLSAPFFPLLPC